MPSAPPSRPSPDIFQPPNGAAALETTPMFRPIIPVFESLDHPLPAARSLGEDVGHEPELGVVREAHGVVLGRRTGMIESTGPKISSRRMSLPGWARR